MMTDQELTVLAARAAGVRFEQGSERPHPKSGAWFGLWLTYDREPQEHERRYWNPLADDGDAFRLAVHLGIEVCDYHQYGRALATLGSTRGQGEFWEMGEPMAATRRAIVRAAADIGRRAGG